MKRLMDMGMWRGTQWLILFFWLTLNSFSGAQEIEATDPLESGFTAEGADTCIKCHDDSDKYPVLSIFSSKHGQQSDPQSPFAGMQCEACHGPGSEHSKRVRGDRAQAPILNFGKRSKDDADTQNAPCLSCHENHRRSSWAGSSHEQNGLACADCHTVHIAKDPVLLPHSQPETCYTCHSKQRAEMARAFVHPVRSSAMTCADCHNPHDTAGDALLVNESVNDTCYECHAEKRGPFLWEHAPVAEDCSNCHVPHGSNHSGLLNKRAPLLCQQCHSQAGHPSLAWSGAGLPSGADQVSRQFLLGKSCLNCHSKIHGSNHPSGIKLTR